MRWIPVFLAIEFSAKFHHFQKASVILFRTLWNGVLLSTKLFIMPLGRVSTLSLAAYSIWKKENRALLQRGDKWCFPIVCRAVDISDRAALFVRKEHHMPDALKAASAMANIVISPNTKKKLELRIY